MKSESIDIKYLKIPNICFSLTEKDDEREEQFRKQRMERGFDDSETWSLDYTVASFIIPRLERYQELANERLARDKQLIREVDMLLEAMKLIVKDEGSHLWNEKEKDIVTQGLALFPKVFTTLWW
ncbi:hypothetical protein [uncultured Marivirga sp.]|jgi:hypothetical protein|uniref:hypothetical protein n=1 Tax=Marivirga tractuosa TaxID=1006 RepID=UPI0030EC4222|tara:strand:- start:22651 stop:23025 length:375 start_codon:yes stop_codon:yes gene_type:complete